MKRNPEDIEFLAGQQRTMLNFSAARLLKYLKTEIETWALAQSELFLKWVTFTLPERGGNNLKQ